ncbi:MAG: hypothetical protein M3220_17895 [Chloroflexota bacterium]|nr:hypothetical protein [Chloroflexota bacterium]
MIAAGVGLLVGWKAFWFLTDDAFIAFRYASNSIQGYGYVWNPPPFQPVEGYTSFLWVLLLDIVWRTSGFEPPVSANVLSLLFSYLTLILASVMVMRLEWAAPLRRYRFVFLLLLLLFLLSNRTFLAWTSSGLENAMFCFFVTLWVFVLFHIHPPARKIFLAALVASALALTRPEGLLYCAGTVAISVRFLFKQNGLSRAHYHTLLGLTPLLMVCLHLIWRFWFYRSWLPNTYYAKVVAPWPESGVRYMLSFILEYGLWFSALIVFAGLMAALLTWKDRFRHANQASVFTFLMKRLRSKKYHLRTVVVLVMLLHVSYYTFIVGGDHFEYRIYNQYIPFIFLLCLWSLNRLAIRQVSRPAIFGLALLSVLVSLPVQWTHWSVTHDLNTREETHMMVVPISPEWPPPLRWYSHLFDDLQSWLITHHVGMRHQEHKVFALTQLADHPPRETGMQLPRADYPVFATYAVGVPGWVLPHVSIIDTLGLNDYVIARTPIPEQPLRLMAHERRPPAGYLESFHPNVLYSDGEVTVQPREEPLAETDIRRIESCWRKLYEGSSESRQGINVAEVKRCR